MGGRERTENRGEREKERGWCDDREVERDCFENNNG